MVKRLAIRGLITIRSLMTLGALTLLVSCSTQQTEQHIPMCQALAENLIGTPNGIVWVESKKITQGQSYEDLRVEIAFMAPNQSGESVRMAATCYYAAEESADEAVVEWAGEDRPHENTPYKIVLNKQVVQEGDLIRAMNSVTIRMVKEMAESASKSIQYATENAKEIAGNAGEELQKATENAKEQMRNAAEDAAGKLKDAAQNWQDKLQKEPSQ